MTKIIWKILQRLRRWNNLRKLKLSMPNQARDIRPYNVAPRLSVIIQLFNKKQNIASIIAALKHGNADEIIVIDDGSRDGAIEILPGLLTGKNEFVVRCNDLFEVRTYSRAIDFSRGEIVALLQDDDLPPESGSWMEEAIALFGKYPKLAVLGGFLGLELSFGPPQEPHDRLMARQPAPSAKIAYTLRSLGPDKKSHQTFDFIEVINRAPMFVRRSALSVLGGIDQVFAPFQCDDVDLCLKAWLGGFQVGLYHAPFVHDVGMGGMRLFNAERIPVQAERNWRIIAERYGARIATGEIASLVAKARQDASIQASL
ncbi:MAG: glycosyltransferase [Rhizomicrobium sp.]